VPGLGPDPAVDVETGVTSGEEAVRPFGTQKLLVDQKPKNLSSEDLSQPRVVDPGDLMEEACLIHSTLGHQEMDVGVEIDPVAECLNGGNNSGHQLAPGCYLEITGQGPEGAAAELPLQPAIVLKEDAQHLRDGEDDLAVGDIQEKLLLHPLAPLLKPLRMARRTEAAGAAGEH